MAIHGIFTCSVHTLDLAATAFWIIITEVMANANMQVHVHIIIMVKGHQWVKICTLNNYYEHALYCGTAVSISIYRY